MTSNAYHPGLHRIALLTAVATFPLIFMGGLVTSHGAGMSVPDWPNSYGYNMFLFPPRLWIGGILYEHTHRLMGTIVGMLSIVLCIWAWKVESRRSVRWLATGVLGAVILQGVLGGLRVVLVELDLAIVHACFAQAFFCLTALMCVVTSRWWIEVRTIDVQPTGRATLLWGSICVILIFAQLVVGAMMRHYDAGLAIPDLPLAYGKALPPLTGEQLSDVNAYRAWALHEKPVSLSQVWLHFGHRIGAIVVSAAIIAMSGQVLRRHNGIAALRRPAVLALALLLAQLALGVLTVLWKKPADLASAHVAVGALTLVTCFVLTLRAWRILVVARPPSAVPCDETPKAQSRAAVPDELVPA
jgi:cytochrome c oxidase assembly protein subunit 15